MASLSTDAAGNRTVQFVAADGKRRSVRLGKLPRKAADAVRLKVDALAAARRHGLTPDAETAAWVAAVSDDLHARLAAAELVAARRSEALGPFLADYLKGREADAKSSSLVNLSHAARDVGRFFGPDTPLRQITPTRAEAYRVHLLTVPATGRDGRRLRPATANRRLKWARQFFAFAVKLKLLPDSPFAGVDPIGGGDASDREYVPADRVRAVMAAAPPLWRLLFGFTRFAGLRCPSEVLLLRWDGIDLAADRMTVRSPKTEHHAGKGSRVVPIFPDVRPLLAEAQADRPAGCEWVVSGPEADGWRAKAALPGGWMNVSLATRAATQIERAGLTTWPRPLHNLRGSCETDLTDGHPLHVVCAWLGNTPAVALKHYTSVRESDYRKASGAAQSGAWGGAEVVQKAVQPPPPVIVRDTADTEQAQDAEGFGVVVNDGDRLRADGQIIPPGVLSDPSARRIPPGLLRKVYPDSRLAG